MSVLAKEQQHSAADMAAAWTSCLEATCHDVVSLRLAVSITMQLLPESALIIYALRVLHCT